MLRTLLVFASAVLGLFLAAQPSGAAAVPRDSRTLFHHAENAWAVGDIRLSKPLTFRNGKILVFPSQITDLLWAPKKTKPRSMMIVHELGSDEKEKPFYSQDDQFFAAIRLLPDHSYWKDNLPNSRRHAIIGGRRYSFRGDEAVEVRRVLTPYMEAHEKKGQARWTGQMNAVAQALGSSVPVVRQDAVAYISIYRSLARDFGEEALPPVQAYLQGEDPVDLKNRLVSALVAGKVVSIGPVLEELSTRDDAVGAVALRGLDQMGKGAPTPKLVELSRSKSSEVAAYATEALGSRAGDDTVALERVRELIAPSATSPELVVATITGLGRSKGDDVVDLLITVIARGDSASRSAAQAVAGIGGPHAVAELSRVLSEQEGEAALAAAAALGTTPGCAQCAAALREQHENHEDPAVRRLAGVLIGVPSEHEH